MHRPKKVNGIDANLSKTVDHYVIPGEYSWDAPEFKLPIKMIRESGKTHFSAIDTDRNIKITHESIDEVMIELDNIMKGRAGIIWTPKLAITTKSVVIDKPPKKVDKYNPLRLVNLDIELKVVPIEIGIDKAGDEWERVQGSNFIQSARTRRGFIPHWKDDPEDSFRDKDESGSLIDDTPENRMALVNLAAGFKEFLKRLYDLLEPDQIESTVKKLFESSAFLLPGATIYENQKK